ncbi:MAG TPA: hypothetical protein DD727_10105, partial [Clostridiales bacterium]|nr:hypothetical protein [Clostridiales bacterium]
MVGKRIWLPFLIFLFIFLNTFESLAEGTNLINNPGFEDDLAGWTQSSFQQKGRISIDGEEPFSGGKAVAISNPEATDTRVMQEIEVEENSIYRISCQVMTRDVGSGESKLGANLSVEGLLVHSEDVKGTSTEWTRLEWFGRTGPNQTTLKISAGLGGYGQQNTGTAWFDEISLVRMEEVPQGVAPVELFSTKAASGTFPPEPNGRGGISRLDPKTLNMMVLGLAAVILLFIAAGMMAAGKSRASRKRRRGFAGRIWIPITGGLSGEDDRLKKPDYLIISGITLAFLLLGMFRLGNTRIPATYWDTRSSAGSYRMELDYERILTRINVFYGHETGAIEIRLLDPDEKLIHTGTIEAAGSFQWAQLNLDHIVAKYIELNVKTPGMDLYEIGVFGTEVTEPLRISPDPVPDSPEQGKFLTDEQDRVVYQPSHMDQMYFDEIYFARTAYEFLHGEQPYEWSHPPLGKLLISVGILIFGMDPFGWRWMGVLLGCLLIPVLYLFARKMFGKRIFAVAAAGLIALDFMVFVQARIGTTDIYLLLFTLLMYYFMYLYMASSERSERLRHLAASGLFFGLAVSVKWSGLYGGLGLALLYFSQKYKEHSTKKGHINTRSFLLDMALQGIGLFILLPAGI